MIDFSVPIFPAGGVAPVVPAPETAIPPMPASPMPMTQAAIPASLPSASMFNVPVLPRPQPEKKPESSGGYSAGQISKAQDIYKKEQATKDKLKAQATPIKPASLEGAEWGKV
jgi:hypothetical protein